MPEDLFFIYAFLFDILDWPQTRYVANDDLGFPPHLPSDGITGMCHHALLMWDWGLKPGL